MLLNLDRSLSPKKDYWRVRGCCLGQSLNRLMLSVAIKPLGSLFVKKVAKKIGITLLGMNFQIWVCFLHLLTILRLLKVRLICLNLDGGFRVWKEQEQPTKIILCPNFSAILN